MTERYAQEAPPRRKDGEKGAGKTYASHRRRRLLKVTDRTATAVYAPLTENDSYSSAGEAAAKSADPDDIYATWIGITTCPSTV